MINILFKNITTYILICILLLPIETEKLEFSNFYIHSYILTAANKYNLQTRKNSQNQKNPSTSISDKSQYFPNNDETRFEADTTNILSDGYIQGRKDGELLGRHIRCNLLKWNCL